MVHRFAACIVALAGMGLITYVLFPAAPPWLAADHGYIDHTYRITHAVVNNLPVPKAGALFQKGTDWGNDVAAVPSLHAAYTMLICLFLWPRINRRWRPLLVAYPIGMGLSLIYLGEHYLIDILLGWVYAAVAVYLVNWGFERWTSAPDRRPADRPAADAPAASPSVRPSRRASRTSVGLGPCSPSMPPRCSSGRSTRCPSRSRAPDGNPVNALLGTANLVLREVETHDPRAVVLCFGPDAATYRLELFPAYHADREAAFPDELRPQWDDSADFFGAFGWKIATSDSFEADDLLGSLAAKESKAGGRSLLMTGDRDMFQCASAETKVLYVSTGKQGGQPMGPAEVKERYGIPPKLVPDLIALRGDPSDGIPGAKGVGEKTAVELLRRHGSLEKVLDAAIREPRPALRTALIGDREQLLAFKDVATLRHREGEPPPRQANRLPRRRQGRPRARHEPARGAAAREGAGLETRSAPPGRGANGATGRRGTYMWWSTCGAAGTSPRSRPVLHRPGITLGPRPGSAKGIEPIGGQDRLWRP